MAGPKRYFPAFLDLEGRHVVVVGSGAAAERKARQMTRYGAEVTVVTPDPSLDLQTAEAQGLVTVEGRCFESGDLEGADLVVCTEEDVETVTAVAAEARGRRILAGVTADPSASGFLFPSVVNREPLQIAISTAGLAPEVAKAVKRRVSDEFGPHWSDVVTVLSETRAIVVERSGNPDAAAALVEAALSSGIADEFASGAAPTAEQIVERYSARAVSTEEDDQ